MGIRLEVRLRRERPATHRAGAKVHGPEAVHRICADLEDADRERFHLLHLDSVRRLIAREEVAVGTLSSTTTTVREVFKGAILRNTAGLIMVHNHPSGDPEPSPEDWDLTRRIAGVGHWLGIPLVDHVIVGRGCFRSLGSLLPVDGPPEPGPAMLQRSRSPAGSETRAAATPGEEGSSEHEAAQEA